MIRASRCARSSFWGVGLAVPFGGQSLGHDEEIAVLTVGGGQQGQLVGGGQVGGGGVALVPQHGDQGGDTVEQQQHRPALAQPVERHVQTTGVHNGVQRLHGRTPTAGPVVVDGGRARKPGGQPVAPHQLLGGQQGLIGLGQPVEVLQAENAVVQQAELQV